MSDLIVSFIRTYVPIAAGWLVSLAVAAGLDVDSAQAETVLTGLCIAVYYALARLIERKYPKAGWLLGAPKAPTYS